MLKELKSYLNITWDEQDPDLDQLINRGKAYLQNKSGTEIDFESDLQAKQLLLDYCRYVRNHTFELYEVNFRRELLSLILGEAVKDRANKKTDPETDS